MASDCVTKKNSQSKATKKQNPWWTQSTKIAKSRKSFWYHMLYRTKNSKQFWKVVGNTRKDLNDCSKDISIDVLEQYFDSLSKNFPVSSRVITEKMVKAQGKIDAKLKPAVNKHRASNI